LQRQNWVRAVPHQGGTSPTKNTSLSRRAVTCIGISLADFENDSVLQIYDIGVAK
jgi:hypothetical protein